METSGDLSADGKAGALQEEVSLSVTPVLVGVFVLCMCGMLVLLYYFFAHLGKSSEPATKWTFPLTSYGHGFFLVELAH